MTPHLLMFTPLCKSLRLCMCAVYVCWHSPFVKANGLCQKWGYVTCIVMLQKTGFCVVLTFSPWLFLCDYSVIEYHLARNQILPTTMWGWKCILSRMSLKWDLNYNWWKPPSAHLGWNLMRDSEVTDKVRLCPDSWNTETVRSKMCVA
jgi:hypothetical protein